MNKERAIYFAGLMEEYLHIPSIVCENIENELINGKYYKVINYVIERRKELENKANYKTYQEFADIVIQLQQENKQLKEHIEKYEHYCKTTGIKELKENQKYKEVFEKAIKLIEDSYYSKNTTDIDSIVLSGDKLLQVRKILKEVE